MVDLEEIHPFLPVQPPRKRVYLNFSTYIPQDTGVSSMTTQAIAVSPARSHSSNLSRLAYTPP